MLTILRKYDIITNKRPDFYLTEYSSGKLRVQNKPYLMFIDFKVISLKNEENRSVQNTEKSRHKQQLRKMVMLTRSEIILYEECINTRRPTYPSVF